jgi:hypothetical protein
MSELVENVLRYPRLMRTVRDARAFEAANPVPASTDGQAQFRMRSAMDLNPRIGKWISKKAIHQEAPNAWTISDVNTSRFVDPAEIDTAVAGIRKNGFYVFKQVVDSSLVTAIRDYAEQAPCQARGFETPQGAYPRSAPEAGRYDFDEEVSLRCPEVQEFVSDPGMALVAQKYLEQPVLMDEVAFWWTTTQHSEMANLNAQLFHQDRDRLSFLKFFIYLTDVNPETGPHVYLSGSHRDIPPSLRGDGRKDDDAVRAAGLWGNVSEINGPAGSLMAVDTIGLHKGKTPIASDRLALEIEFATSLFGAHYERPLLEPTSLMRERFAQMPWVLQRYASSISS